MPTRKTKSLSKKWIQQERAFERTRENMSEFGRAGTANRLLRSALKDILPNVADRYVSGRLTKRMMRIIQSDPIHGRGERIITPDALPMLEGFNFNRSRALSDAFYAPYQVSFKRSTGIVTLSVPFFNATTMADAGASAFSLIGSAIAIDFTCGEVEPARYQTDIIEMNNTNTRSIHITVSLPAGIPHPVIMIFGIEFYGISETRKPTITDRIFNAMAVVKVFV